VRGEELCYTFSQPEVKGAGTRLDWGSSAVLVIVRLGLWHYGGDAVVRVGTRGIGGNDGVAAQGKRGNNGVAIQGIRGSGRVRGVDIAFSVVDDGVLDPLDVLHVGHPYVVPGLAGPDGGSRDGRDVSKEEYPVQETKRGDRLSGPTEGVDATNDATESGSGLGTGRKPHDTEVRQPSDLEGNPGCEGSITEATNDGHSNNRAQVNDCRGNGEGRIVIINPKVDRGLGQGICGETKDEASKDVGRR